MNYKAGQHKESQMAYAEEYLNDFVTIKKGKIEKKGALNNIPTPNFDQYVGLGDVTKNYTEMQAVLEIDIDICNIKRIDEHWKRHGVKKVFKDIFWMIGEKESRAKRIIQTRWEKILNARKNDIESATSADD